MGSGEEVEEEEETTVRYKQVWGGKKFRFCSRNKKLGAKFAPVCSLPYLAAGEETPDLMGAIVTKIVVVVGLFQCRLILPSRQESRIR